MVQRYYAAIKALLEGLQNVVKAFTTSLLCHHYTLTAMVDRESAEEEFSSVFWSLFGVLEVKDGLIEQVRKQI